MMQESKGSQMDESVEGLVALNALDYKKIYPLSVASSSQWRTFRALRDGFVPGSTAFVDIAPGASFLDPKVSYLTFMVSNAADLNGNLGEAGSSLNFLSETVVRSRSGVELSRSQVHNLGRNMYNRFRNSNSWPESVGSALFSSANAFGGAGTRVVIPLPDVNPFFGTNTLLPSMLGQLRLEISWAPLATVYVAPNEALDNYIITDLRVVTKTYDLADAVLKRLAYNASQSGLALPFVDIHHTLSISPGGQSTANSIKSASRALFAYCVPQETGRLTAAGADSMATAAWVEGLQKFQWSLGSQFVTSEPIFSNAEGLVQANHAFGLWNRAEDIVDNQVSLQSYAQRFGIMACSLERSHVLQYNGSAVSSARPLLLQATFGEGNHSIHIFLAYLRMAIVFSDSNVALKE